MHLELLPSGNRSNNGLPHRVAGKSTVPPGTGTPRGDLNAVSLLTES